MLNRTPSPVDVLFEELYGFIPQKAGKSLEMLIAAGLKAINPSLDVKLDSKIIGNYSANVYQIDSTVSGINQTFIEAKDLSVAGHKVKRSDLEKLQGSIIMLNNDDAIIFTSTEFTSEAKKYSDATLVNPATKPIYIGIVRPSDVEDEKGRIKEFHLSIILCLPRFDEGDFEPIFSKEAYEILQKENLIGNNITYKIDFFYDKNGAIIKSFSDFSSLPENQVYKKGVWDNYISEGEWVLPEGYHTKVEDILLETKIIKYKIPIRNSAPVESIVKAEGSPRLLVKIESLGINKLLTDSELRSISFRSDGEVVLNK